MSEQDALCIWVIRPTDKHSHTRAVLVRAETPDEARHYANNVALANGDQSRTWADYDKSYVEALATVGEEGVIIYANETE